MKLKSWKCPQSRSFSYKLLLIYKMQTLLLAAIALKLKNGNSVILMPLDRVLSIVWSSASWMMRSGHSNSQVAPWSLGHSYGAVFPKSGVPVTVQWSPSWWWHTRQLSSRPVWNCVPKTIPSQEPTAVAFIDFYVPNSMHQIPFLLQIPVEWFLFPDKSSAWYTCTDSR